MTCRSCGTVLADAAKFCHVCGERQSTTCAACGRALPAEAAFCPHCGTPTAATAGPPTLDPVAPEPRRGPTTERRVCAVLFADLVGFTPLSETRDPEEVRELLSRYFDVSRTVIARYGGVVEKFIGDAVMAVWGTPTATEVDSEMAVRAALDLVDAVTVLGTQAGIPALAARAGVVTGEVAVNVGAVGEGMVAGDAVNKAARIQAAAEPRTVFTDTATSRLAAAAIGFADAGLHPLKGKTEPEQLWRATRVVAGTGGAQRVDGLEGALVGRDAELRLVKELFHAAADRRSTRMVVVAGAAGVGKSRLGWEFEKYIDGLAQVVAWHRGRCLAYGEGVAFWALAEAVRQRLQIAEDDAADVAAGKLAARLASIVPDVEERAYVAVRIGRLLGVPVPGDDGRPLAREELFAGWRILFERLAATRPVTLLVEDLQYADDGMLDFLDHLVDWARDLPIFVLALTRPELEERRPGFGVGRNRTMLTLDPLDPASMDALVDALVPGMPATARAAITRHAQGIPLFAVETIRSLIDRDVVQPVEGVYRLVGDVGELAVPDSLHALLAARLDALDPAVRALVADAAVLGSSFPAEALVAVSEQPEAAVRAGLAELVRREVLTVSADPLSPQRGEYRFAQELLRQVAYETLSRHDRKLRHLAVATHLRSTFADDGEEVSDAIARHYRDALSAVPGAPDTAQIRAEAVRMFVRAADRAARAGAPGASSASYATAAELAQTADQPTDGGRTDAASLWERAADVACIAAQHEPAIEYAQRAKALHERAGRVRDAARAQSLVGRALRLAGRHRAARAELEPAVEVLRENPDVDTVVAIEHLATVAVFDGAPEGDALTAEALALGQALDVGPAVLARLFTARGFAYGFTNRTAEAAACFEYAAHLAAKVGDGHTQGRALANLADALSGDDVPAALEAATAAIDVLRRLGAQDMLDLAVVNQVEQLVTIGRWDEAEQVLDYALSRDATGFRDFVRWQRGWLAALRGDVEVVEESLAGLAHMRASEDPQDRGAVALLEAQAALLAGDQQRALAVARGAVTHTLTIGLRELVVWAWSIATRAAHAQGELATEADLVALLDGYPVGHVPHLLRAERDIARARLARAGLGPDLDDRDPVELFDQAVAALRRVPAPYHVAHALLDEAEGVGGEEGLRLVQEAADIAARLGARPLAQRAASCAAALGAGREPATRAG